MGGYSSLHQSTFSQEKTRPSLDNESSEYEDSMHALINRIKDMEKRITKFELCNAHLGWSCETCTAFETKTGVKKTMLASVPLWSKDRKIVIKTMDESRKFKEKIKELTELVVAEHDQLVNKLRTIMGYRMAISTIGENREERDVRKLNQLISIWNQKGRQYVEPYKDEVQDASERMKSEVAGLRQMYSMVMVDIGENGHESIQGVYVDQGKHKVIIDAKWNSTKEVEAHIRGLSGYKQYQEFISIIESNPGENLKSKKQLAGVGAYPSFTKLVGQGSGFTVIDGSQECLDELLNDQSISTLSEATWEIGSVPLGTLGCICILDGEVYAMTAQHVLSSNDDALSNKHILSEVKYSCDGLYLADLVHLSSSHFGKLGTIPKEGHQRAVDVALMKLNQRNLTTGRMKLMPIFTRSHITALFPERPTMLRKKVRKIGATTGPTEGEIIMEDYYYPIRTQQYGTMFAVDVSDDRHRVFATHGDSGALVTIDIEGHAGAFEQYALGIVSQQKEVLGRKNAVLCVWLEDCLHALEHQGLVSVDITPESVQLYSGFLTVNACVNNRREAFKSDRVLVYRR